MVLVAVTRLDCQARLNPETTLEVVLIFRFVEKCFEFWRLFFFFYPLQQSSSELTQPVLQHRLFVYQTRQFEVKLHPGLKSGKDDLTEVVQQL